MSLLSLEDVHTYYGEAHILQGVSLSVGDGEVVTMIGRNGAGKTTTLLSIMGIARARRGAVRMGGQDITNLETHEIVRRGIGWVPEERRVLPNLTVLENLRLGTMAAPGPDAERRLEEALEYFPRLRERVAQKGRFLSGGEQQMLAIARGLVADPRGRDGSLPPPLRDGPGPHPVRGHPRGAAPGPHDPAALPPALIPLPSGERAG